MKSFALTALTLLTSVQGMACTADGHFLPESDTRIPADQKVMVSGITEAAFNRVISRIEGIYAPLVRAEGGRLRLVRLWQEDKVNARAHRLVSRAWTVEMFGGLARHPAMTEDGLALVMCHEIGHHIGGAPKRPAELGEEMTWASNEGQSDYFATLKCLRRVFRDDDNASAARAAGVPATLRSACTRAFPRTREANLCIRSAMAGQAVANLFHSESPLRTRTMAPAFNTPSRFATAVTFNGHPPAQCRLDTYLQGALCAAPLDDDVDQEDALEGTCNAPAARGVRPACWYRASR